MACVQNSVPSSSVTAGQVRRAIALTLMNPNKLSSGIPVGADGGAGFITGQRLRRGVESGAAFFEFDHANPSFHQLDHPDAAVRLVGDIKGFSRPEDFSRRQPSTG